ncbi:MAG: DUF4249 family protein [Bacteroidales bacterium]
MKAIYYLLLAGSALSCEPRWNYDTEGYESEVVVEGWIEAGSYPRVLLSQSISSSVTIDTTGWVDIPVYWAKVTVSDGEQTEVLTGRYDANYLPPYTYTGSQIKGQPGKEYTLLIECSGRTVRAKTRIPEGNVSMRHIDVSRVAEKPGFYQVEVGFYDDPATKDYYKFFTRVHQSDLRYYSSQLGTIDDGVIANGSATVPVYKYVRNYTDKNGSQYFKPGDKLSVKITRIGREEFLFWNSYDNQLTNNKNPIFGNVSNLKSNIEGGTGIWCGYLTQEHHLMIWGEERIEF